MMNQQNFQTFQILHYKGNARPFSPIRMENVLTFNLAFKILATVIPLVQPNLDVGSVLYMKNCVKCEKPKAKNKIRINNVCPNTIDYSSLGCHHSRRLGLVTCVLKNL